MPETPAGHEPSGGGILAITIVTPDGRRAEFQARHFRAPGIEGDFGVLPGHIPFMTALRIGPLVIEGPSGKQIWATSGGFAEVLADRITILAETAERSDQIDVARAEAARKRALDRLAHRSAEEIDLLRANASLTRAINRLRVAGSA